MKKVLRLLVIVLLVTSCKTTKIQESYSWEGKKVSKRQYDLLLYKYTVDFVNNYPKKEDLKTFESLEVVYDTIVRR